MNIYVGNLSYSVKEQDLEDLFAEFGAITSVKLITDTHSGRSKGFAFVEMAESASGEEAIAALDGTEYEGRKIVVNPARPKEEGGNRGGGFRSGNRGGGNRGGNGGGDRGGYGGGGNRGGGNRRDNW